MRKQKILIREGSLTEVIAVANQIPEFIDPYKLKDYQHRLTGKRHLVLLAIVDETLAGFKVGYALNENIFYSWFGGIRPEFRQKGLASKLAAYQEKWVAKNGFNKVRVKTRNSFKLMLLFAIKSGFQIIDIERQPKVKEYRILLEKELG